MSLGLYVGSSYRQAAAVEDYFFEYVSNILQPLDNITDDHDTWDLDSDGNIMPAITPTEEGWFDLDSDSNIQPIAGTFGW